MRILFLSSDFPSPWDPGRGPFNLALVRALRRGNNVRVICPVPWLKRLRRGRQRSASIDVELDVFHPIYFYPPKMARWAYDEFYWMSVRSLVRRLIHARRPDVVVAYWAHPDGAAAVRAAKECGAISAIIVGGSDVLMITRDPARRAAVKAALSGTDAVIAVSEHLRNAVIGLGIPPAKVHVWSQGVDKLTFRTGNRETARGRLTVPPKAPVVLWVGRMVPVKGLDVLLRAMPLVRERHPNVHLYLVGDGEQRRTLETQARTLHINDMTHFVGNVRPTQLADWYRAADVTVLPSRSEGLPNVLRESLVCGTPFVASRVGGIPEIARLGIDRLVEAGNRRELAAALIAALDARSAVPAAVPQFPSWETSAEALLQIVTRLIKPVLRFQTGTAPRGREVEDLADALVHPHS